MFSLAFALIALVGFSILAFWSKYPPLFMIVGGISMMTGLKFNDVFSGDTGLSVGLCLIAYAFIAMAFALRYIFWLDEGE
jgi:hypothetical protein